MLGSSYSIPVSVKKGGRVDLDVTFSEYRLLKRALYRIPFTGKFAHCARECTSYTAFILYFTSLFDSLILRKTSNKLKSDNINKFKTEKVLVSLQRCGGKSSHPLL